MAKEALPPYVSAHETRLAVAQGLLAGVAAIYLFARAISLLGASRASTFPALVPVFGIVVGYLALGEVPTAYQLAGLAVVALGFRLANSNYLRFPSPNVWERTSARGVEHRTRTRNGP